MIRHLELPIMPVESPPNWYNLLINGKVPKERVFSAQEILDMPEIIIKGDFFCNDGWMVKDLAWSGIPISQLLKLAEVNRKEVDSIKVCSDDYFKTFDMVEVLQGNLIIATKLNGDFLSFGHGGPCRLIGGSRSGDNHVKWVKSIEVS